MNSILTFLCFWGAVSLLDQGSFFLRDRWHPDTGTYFSGMPLYLLAFGLFFLGTFATAVTLAWIRRTVSMPDQRKIRPDPVLKGQIIVRYWYLVLPALILVLSAFVLAKHTPDPSFHATPHSSAAKPHF